MTPTARLDHPGLAPRAYKALGSLHAVLRDGTLGVRLLDLVYLRVSQMNGCAYCIDMHWRDLVAHDEDVRRLNSLPGWREAPFFDARERAALQWAELLTDIPRRDPSDADFAALREHFSEVEAAELSYAIACINAWNRIGVGLRPQIALAPA